MATNVNVLNLVIQAVDNTGKVLDGIDSKVGKVGKSIKALTSIMTGIGAVAGSAFAGSSAAAIKFEDQMANVKKTTGATNNQLQNISENLLDMSTKSRTSASDLAEIATVGGQLGISADKILPFTNAIDKLNVALGDEFSGGAEQVTQEIGKLRNVFTDIQSDSIDTDLLKIGNALNELGASGFATGPVMSDMASRIGGLTSSLGMQAGNILGMSAAMQELNITAERGGSNVGRIFQKMTTDSDEFAQIAGMSLSSFSELLDTDINQAFIKVLEGVNSSSKSATQMAGVIDSLGLKGTGTSEIIQKLASNTSLLSEKQNLANQALSGSDSILTEFETKNSTTAAQMDKLKNSINEIAVTLGNAFLPRINDLVNNMMPIISLISDWVSKNPELSTRIIGIGTSIGVLGGAIKTFMGIKGMFKTLTPLLNPLKIGITKIGVALKLLAANPVVLIITAIVVAIGLLVAGFIYLWKNCEGFRNFWINLWNGIKNIASATIAWFQSIPEKVSSIFEAIKNFFSQWGQNILELLSPVLNIPNLISQAFETVKTFFSNLWQNITDGFSKFVEFLSKIPELISNFLAQLPEKIGFVIGFIIGKIARFFVDMWTLITEQLPLIIENIILFFQQLYEKISLFFQMIVEGWITLLTNIWNFATTTLPKIIEGVVGFFAQLPGKIWTWLVNAYQKITAWLQNTWVLMTTKTQEIITDVVNFFSQLPGKIWTWLLDVISKTIQWLSEMKTKTFNGIQEVCTGVINYFSELPEKILEIGKNIVKGLWNGIKAMGGWLKDKISGFVKGVIDGFKSGFGIHSPSVIFAELGKFNIEGLELGMQNAIKKLPIGEMTSNITHSFSSSNQPMTEILRPSDSNKSNSIVNNSKDNNLTIEKVVINNEVDFELFSQNLMTLISSRVY